MFPSFPAVSVNMPRDKITQLHQGYAFCEFQDSDTADYAVRLMNMIKLYGKQLRINKVGHLRTADTKHMHTNDIHEAYD